MAVDELEYKTVRQFVDLQLDYVSTNIPLASGGVLGPFVTAIAYGVALVAVVLQRLIQLTINAARLSTAEGDDLDSFVADFGLSRGLGAKATGQVTFSRFTPAVSSILIPDGTVVQTASSQAIQFVTVPSAAANYDSVQKGHILLVGGTSAVADVQAVEIGTQGNIGAATITQIASTIPGIDTVTNGAQFTTGEDEETDNELRQDFVNYIQSLPRATVLAIGNAITLGRQNLLYTIVETLTPTPDGIVKAYFDDGSGSAGSYITDVQASINLVRPAGVRVDATAATATNIGIVAKVLIDQRATQDVLELRGLIQNAVANYVNTTVKPGYRTHYGQIWKAILNASSPGNAIITSILTSPASTTQVLKISSTIGISIGQIVKAGAYVTAAGTLPSVLSIDDFNTLTLSLPLTAIPPAGTSVKIYSVADDLILDVDLVANSVVVASTTISSISGSGSFTVVSTAGMAAPISQHVILTDETDPLNPIFYQAQPDSSINTANQDLIIGALPGGNVVTLLNGTTVGKIGVINSQGIWTEVGTGGVPLPAIGTKVVVVSNTNGDISPSGYNVLRVKTRGSNAIGIHLEFNEAA